MTNKFFLQVTLTFALSILLSISLKAQSPNFVLTDIDGVEHNLYEDYLDEGKTVLLSFGATWNRFDTTWIHSKVLQKFQNDYVSTGSAAVFFIDPFNPTIDDFMGTGINSIGYDFVSAANFPLISTGSNIINEFEVVAFPTLRMICPDKTAYTDSPEPSNIFTYQSDLIYVNFESAEQIADKMFENCGTDFTSSTKELNKIGFSISPNPTSDILNIQINQNDWKSGKIDILDVTGKLRFTKSLDTEKNVISVSNLEDGIYILALTNSKGQRATQMLSVIK